MSYIPQPPYPVQQPMQQPIQQQYVPQPVQQPMPQQYVPQPVQPYPQPNTQTPYPAQYPAAPPMTPEQQRAYTYRRKLRSTANGLGGLMLIFFGLEIVIGIVIIAALSMSGNAVDDSEASVSSMLESGLISTLVFFVAGLIYCLIRRLSFAEIFPFEKIKASFLLRLSVIGITFSLMSNYVVSLLDNTFSLFGIENNGGTFDFGSEPNVFLYFLTVAIMPALVEEFAFRGVVMGSLRPFSDGLAILVSSALFALMHGNFVQMPFTFCCGLVFAYMDIKTNSLLPSIIVHFLNNGLSVLFEVLVTYDVMNENWANISYGIIFVITGALSLIFLKGIINKHDNHFFDLKRGNTVLPFKKKVGTVASSPTMISFAAVMVLYSIYALFL